jgi:heat shock protein HslJ
VTLRVETEPNAIAAGNAGCNRYTGPYTIRGDSIAFGPSISTKMACVEGMDVEASYLSMLPTVVRYAVADSTLTFFGAAGAVAEYRDRSETIR